jgi:hypothetical protein
MKHIAWFLLYVIGTVSAIGQTQTITIQPGATITITVSNPAVVPPVVTPPIVTPPVVTPPEIQGDIVPYLQVNGFDWHEASSVTVTPGSTVSFGPQPLTGGTWSWTGPNGFTASTRQIDGLTTAGIYVATYTPTSGVVNQLSFELSVAPETNKSFLASIFPANSIFHRRVDSLPADTSPFAPFYPGYLSSAIRPFFGPDPCNGIPVVSVPPTQPLVNVTVTQFQQLFHQGPIPPRAPIETCGTPGQDNHVSVYWQAGTASAPQLYEMWEAGPNADGSWTAGSNTFWPDVTSNKLNPNGTGSADAAGLPIAPLLYTYEEVAANSIHHIGRLTLNHIGAYWVWPARQTAGTGYCTDSSGHSIPGGTQLSQSAPPASCTAFSPAGEIYRLKASTVDPACLASSPQAKAIVTAFRQYGLFIADNGISGGVTGVPDSRWNATDLSCLSQLHLSDFEPVNVSGVIVNNDSGEVQ